MLPAKFLYPLTGVGRVSSFNPSTFEAEAGKSPGTQSWSCSHSKFQAGHSETLSGTVSYLGRDGSVAEGQEPGAARRQWPRILARCALTGGPVVSRASLGSGRAGLLRRAPGTGAIAPPGLRRTPVRGARHVPRPLELLSFPARVVRTPPTPASPAGDKAATLLFLGRGQRPPRLGQGGIVGGGSRRAAAGAWIRGPWTSRPSSACWWPVAGGRAMLLVLLSLAAMCRSALPREPVSIPLCRGHPFPRFPSF